VSSRISSSVRVRSRCAASALALPPLRHLLDERGQLSDDDARALVAWVETARGVRGMRVVVLLDDADRSLELSVPMQLGDWVDAAGDGHAYVVTPSAPAVVEKSRLVDTGDTSLELGEAIASHIGDTLRPPEPVLGELLARPHVAGRRAGRARRPRDPPHRSAAALARDRAPARGSRRAHGEGAAR
jgi:hypothetical protein